MKGKWKYFYRAVDSNGDTIDFMLSAIPRVITVDKDPAYPPAIGKLKNDKILPKNIGIRRIKYLNNIIEQDHRFIKRIVNPMLGFQFFHSANKNLKFSENVFISLDLIRALSAQTVLIGHWISFLSILMWLYPPNFPWIQEVVVVIFFLLSDLVITYSTFGKLNLIEYNFK